MSIIWTGLFVIFFLLFGSIYLGILWIYGKFNKKAADLATLRFVQWAFRCVMAMSGVKLKVYGKENIPEDEAVLYVANHRGIFDVVTTYTLCPGVTGYIAKDNVEKIPFLSWYMKRLYCLFLDREDIKKGLKTIITAIDQVKNGISIFIFPEGTRNTDVEHPNSLLTFKEGSFKIAEKTGCKIVPMAITGSEAILENHVPWLHRGKITVVYGKPIVMAELEKKDQRCIGAYCQKYVQELLNEAVQRNGEV